MTTSDKDDLNEGGHHSHGHSHECSFECDDHHDPETQNKLQRKNTQYFEEKYKNVEWHPGLACGGALVIFIVLFFIMQVATIFIHVNSYAKSTYEVKKTKDHLSKAL